MKQAEYTTKNLYSKFKPEDVCFVVAKSYGYINELSYLTDDMNDALSFAKENDYKIFVFKKKFASDCLYPDMLFQNMLDDLEDEGLDSSYLLNYIGEDGKKDGHQGLPAINTSLHFRCRSSTRCQRPL